MPCQAGRVRCIPLPDPQAPDDEPETYEGERDLKSLKKFVKSLGPKCTVDGLDKCSKKQKEALQPYLEMPVAELEEQVAKMKETLAASKKAHDELMQSLQAQYKESEEKNKALADELTPKLKLMRAAIPKKVPKDEV